MTELVINPYVFIMPVSLFGIWAVTHNRNVLNIAGMALVAAVVITALASNPVKVSDSANNIWHQCRTQMHAGAKTCHIVYGPVMAKPSSEQGG